MPELFPPNSSPPFSPERAAELSEVIPVMGNEEPIPYTSEKPIRVEEQYELNERKALAITTTPIYYDILTEGPKRILAVADGADMYIEFNRQIDGDSQKIFNGSSLSITSKGITRIWAQAVIGTGTLRLTIFKR